MTDAELTPFLQAIQENPEDPGSYLVLADWLQERKEPWGKLIVLAQSLEEQPGNAAIAAEMDSLIRKQGWNFKAKPEHLRLEWRWGFLRQVRIYDDYNDVDVPALAATLGELPLASQLESFWLFCQHPNNKDALLAKLREHLPATTDVAVIEPLEASRSLEDAPPETRWLDVGQRVPKAIGAMKGVHYLECCGARSLPEAIAELPRLERLNLNWSYSLRRIPDAIWGIETLGYISLYDCSELGLNMGQVNNLLAGFVRARAPRAQRILEAKLFVKGRASGATVEDLLEALDSNVTAVRTAALTQLGEELEDPLPSCPIGEGSVVVTLGSLNLDKKALKARLEGLGATIATKVTAKTTHVLVGHKPKGRHLDLGELPLVLEAHLTALASPAAEPGAKATAALDEEKLAKALRCRQDKRIVAAVSQLQHHGGIPSPLLPELFAVLSDTELGKKGKGRAQARKLFNAYAPKPLQTVMGQHFKTSVLLAGETKRRERIEALAATKGTELDVERLVKIFVEDHDCGFSYLFEQSAELRDWAIARRMKDKHLDLSGLELSSLPELSSFPDLEIVDASNNHLGRFPLDRLSTALKSIDLSSNYLRALPRKLSQYTALTHLNLAYNRFERFPLGACTLPAVEVLHLTSGTYDETRIVEIPKEIASLKSLVELHIGNGREAVKVPEELGELSELKLLSITWAGSNEDLPKALVDLLPNCTIR